jgi:Xaa-Pro aminopeptidase
LFQHARREKDDAELSLLRKASASTAAGFAKVAAVTRAGVSERQIQIELEAEYFRHGADQTGFGTIVGSGTNSAVLHYSPSERRVCDGDFVLVDSGAQIRRYTADVTRTFFVGKNPGFKRDLYELVLCAQKAAINRCIPGAEWKEVHLACAVDLVAGLVSLGLMKGNPAGLVEREAHSLFFPHGLGHMVGLGVRDASGLLPGRLRDTRLSLRSLRMDLPLLENYVVTVEPGLYFIPALLNDPARRSHFGDCVNWSLVDRHIGCGGVRIEDDVRVRQGTPEVLTAAIPKHFTAL